MESRMESDRRRLLEKLLRELVRVEDASIAASLREARRLGAVPPVESLRAIGNHATGMRRRFARVCEWHGLQAGRSSLQATFGAVRHLVTDRGHDPERAYRAALLGQRHALDVVAVLREVAMADRLFALIRWCDDWLGERRAHVARAQAQLAWFAGGAPPVAAAPSAEPQLDPAAQPGDGAFTAPSGGDVPRSSGHS
jgi:hypothetical protein